MATHLHQLYDRFHSRLLKMNRTADIGLGYGDFVYVTAEFEEILEKRYDILYFDNYPFSNYRSIM